MANPKLECNDRIFRNSNGVKMKLTEIANKNIVTSVTIKYKLFKSHEERQITIEDKKYGLILNLKRFPECELQFYDSELFSKLEDGTYDPESIKKRTCIWEIMTRYRFAFDKENIVQINWS